MRGPPRCTCRVWSARLVGRAQSLLEELLPAELAPAAAELAPYLADSFGNATRIDYGTGEALGVLCLVRCGGTTLCIEHGTGAPPAGCFPARLGDGLAVRARSTRRAG
jgi:hypothetical protein